jgi:hypothetical protein
MLIGNYKNLVIQNKVQLLFWNISINLFCQSVGFVLFLTKV